MRNVFSISLVAAAAWLLLGDPPARSCDTPVYRYAMYRWEPAPYEVYYFHRGPIAEDAARLHKIIEQAATSEKQPANLMLALIDLDKDKDLKGVPRDVRKLWESQAKPDVPSYLMATPHGTKLLAGKLDEALLKALLDSPVRRQVTGQLAAGKACVFLLLAGKDKTANDAAEKAAKAVIQDVASGKIEIYTAPPMIGEAPQEGEKEAAKPKPPEFGLVTLARDDPQERWLVESLLAMDSQLAGDEIRDKPMLFGVFGRGRALPPFVAEEIKRENLLACVDFVTGACSCTVKDQNPGMDLLLACDWHTVAEKLAEKFGAEEGTEGQYSPEAVFPRLVMPGPGEAEKPKPAAESPKAPAAKPAADKVAQDPVKDPAKEAPAKAAPSPPKPADEPAGVGPDKPTDEEPSGALVASTPFWSVFAVGAGMAVALLILFGLTFLVLRPR